MKKIPLLSGFWKAIGTVASPSGKRFFNQIALYFAERFSCPQVFSFSPEESWFQTGQGVGYSLLSRNLFPFLLFSEDHALTGGVYEMLHFFFPRKELFLLVLDAHLDIFPHDHSPHEVHRGNFLLHLLKKGSLPESRLLVFSPRENLEIFAHLPRGFYYLSWDIDFGFPQYAHFPTEKTMTFSRLKTVFSQLSQVLKRPGCILVGMDIVEVKPLLPRSRRLFSLLSLALTTLTQNITVFCPFPLRESQNHSMLERGAHRR